MFVFSAIFVDAVGQHRVAVGEPGGAVGLAARVDAVVPALQLVRLERVLLLVPRRRRDEREAARPRASSLRITKASTLYIYPDLRGSLRGQRSDAPKIAPRRPPSAPPAPLRRAGPALVSTLRALPAAERAALFEAVAGAEGAAAAPSAAPSSAQLRRLFVATAIPMVGFGFVDNSVMIASGEFLEVQLGALRGVHAGPRLATS
ncbi:hypothetical protein JL720_9636 [Aureococcus anophagefferens]|nr:hypothetical protein JL720_9636 [Aureococcus anophagefferens]